MNTKPSTEDASLPVGIWKEPDRRRYRIRLYARRVVVHLSYHKTLHDALTAYPDALKAQQDAYNRNTPRAISIRERIAQLKTSLQ
jgi:hypothetical protein